MRRDTFTTQSWYLPLIFKTAKTAVVSMLYSGSLASQIYDPESDFLRLEIFIVPPCTVILPSSQAPLARFQEIEA